MAATALFLWGIIFIESSAGRNLPLAADKRILTLVPSIEQELSGSVKKHTRHFLLSWAQVELCHGVALWEHVTLTRVVTRTVPGLARWVSTTISPITLGDLERFSARDENGGPLRQRMVPYLAMRHQDK
jgi:hypothetical protein